MAEETLGWKTDLQMKVHKLKVGEVLEVTLVHAQRQPFITTALREYVHQSGSVMKLVYEPKSRVMHVQRLAPAKAPWTHYERLDPI